MSPSVEQQVIGEYMEIFEDKSVSPRKALSEFAHKKIDALCQKPDVETVAAARFAAHENWAHYYQHSLKGRRWGAKSQETEEVRETLRALLKVLDEVPKSHDETVQKTLSYARELIAFDAGLLELLHAEGDGAVQAALTERMRARFS